MSHFSVTYPSGTEARAGDIVTYHGERSIVELVIVDQLIAEWGVEESGLLLQNASFERVFVPASGFDEDEDFAYVSRGNNQPQSGQS